MLAERDWNEVRGLRSFADLVLNFPPETPLQRTVDLATCPGFVYLSHEDISAIQADYNRLRGLEATGLYR
jgi:hypothetical protein